MPPKKLSKTLPKAETLRLQKLMVFENEARAKGYRIIAGIDEAGRGPLAGPVVAAACVIEEGVVFSGINDSKLLTPKRRKELFHEITTHSQVTFGIGQASVEEIDLHNIYQATLIAMKRAIDQLCCRPDCILADAILLDYHDIPCEKIIQGDQKSQSIAAASVLAKETRDKLMEEFHLLFPQYAFDQHKGYGTARHLEALKKYGPCALHRRSFAPVKESMALVGFYSPISTKLQCLIAPKFPGPSDCK